MESKELRDYIFEYIKYAVILVCAVFSVYLFATLIRKTKDDNDKAEQNRLQLPAQFVLIKKVKLSKDDNGHRNVGIYKDRETGIRYIIVRGEFHSTAISRLWDK